MTDYVEKGAKAYLTDEFGNPISLAAPVCLGEYQATVDTSGSDNDLASIIAAATPAGASPATLALLKTAGVTFFTVGVESNDVRVSFFGADPSTAGQLYPKGAAPYAWNPSDPTKVKVAGQGGSATLHIVAWR